MILGNGFDDVNDFDKDSLMRQESANDGQFIGEGKMIDIESRKDKDAFFDSLGGWNNDDKLV